MPQAVILVGGRGTRLGELARRVPKPLMSIAGGKPFLDYVIEKFARSGVDRVLLLAGHLGEVVQQQYDGATICGARVRVIIEPTPAGTAGALHYAADLLDDVFFMANGDTLIDMDYRALSAALEPSDVGVLALRRMPDASRYGRVELDGRHIIAFHEKDAALRGEALISAGAYYLRRGVLDLIATTPCSIETEIFPRLAAARALRGVETRGYFIDIGLPETLAEAQITVPGMFKHRGVDLATKLRQQAQTARAWLFEQALPVWWGRGFDHVAQCFHESLAPDGAPVPTRNRIRTQARHTAAFALAGALGWPGPWREATEAGADVLLKRAIRADGGTRHALGASGETADDRRDLYDLACVVFGLAEAGRALARPDLVAAANDLLNWAKRNWAHSEGGFHEGEIAAPHVRRQNPHMHMFEAALSIYQASGDRGHLGDAAELARLLRDKIFDAGHSAVLEVFEGDTASQIVEPGHEFEWSWLLHRYHALGGADLSALAERLRVHAERFGVDRTRNAVFDEIYSEGKPRVETSRLWPNTERLKANLVRFERTRDPAAGVAALEACETLTRYFDTPLRGLWRDKLLPDNSFLEAPAPASSLYHLTFAISELICVAGAQ